MIFGQRRDSASTDGIGDDSVSNCQPTRVRMFSRSSQKRPLRLGSQLLFRNLASTFCGAKTVSLIIQRSGIGLLSQPGTASIMRMCSSHEFPFVVVDGLGFLRVSGLGRCSFSPESASG